MKKYFLFSICFIVGSYQILIAQTPEPDDQSHEKWEFILEDTGDILQLALPIGAGLTTIIKGDWKGTKQFALSYSTSFIITHSLKKIVKKERPEGRNLFDAFPSGHTTSAFSGASFIQRRYGWQYGKWAYLLAGIVGVSRMEGPNGWHDIWDVLAGATVGIGSTYLFTAPYEKKKIDVGFFSDGKETYVLTLKYKF
ncbi:phosphatase PAP2 family protein [Ichthyenterobacterium magnum]|uniref:Membrane-associated phospholipid phosphatase n=1 Tax=Ichthyenterobacterium magnum TaxID=1230530 RepID=A0A420DGG3_9FLAO|nr:phosphatase PAP2 family protein [Ichthyenterobacterium magnum]RKE92182.1 membrane-associated phospholipid phosphatase [Ichthyenterobacterium magnum]